LHTGKVAGTQIILNNWFLVLLGLFALAGMLGKVLIVFGAIICHELAHAGTAHLLGFKVREIELLPFGGVARIDRLNEAAPVQDMLIAAAGPLCSLVLAAFTHLMMTKFAYRHEEWAFFLQVNIMLACFNLYRRSLWTAGESSGRGCAGFWIMAGLRKLWLLSAKESAWAYWVIPLQTLA
jgi:stage IV sporulation protein FB